jgi:uncharacterized protein
MGEQTQAWEPDGQHTNLQSSTMATGVPLDRTPFAEIRGRVVLAGVAVAAVLAGVIVGIASLAHLLGNSESVQIETFGVLFFGFYALFIACMVRRSRLDPMALFGPLPPWSLLWRNGLIAVPLMIVSVVLTFFSFFFLSYLFPDFVQSWFLDWKTTVVWGTGEGYVLANVLSFFSTVLMAPVLEEFVFRGLLLTRWTLKWNLQRAILVSSAIFGLGHFHVLGAFASGYVFSLVYIRTRSLFASIAVHATNNFLAWVVAVVALYVDPSTETTTLDEFRSGWLVMLILGLAVTPWVVKLVRQHHAILNQGIPYIPVEGEHVQARGESRREGRPSVDGVLVLRTRPGSNADKVGIMEGDVIVQYDGVRGLTTQSLGALVAAARFQGGVKRIVFVRDGTERSVLVRPIDLGISAVDAREPPSSPASQR